MRDFPVFTTEYGVVSLILKEIPYRKEAYIRILDAQPGMVRELLKECGSFCTMAGAEKVYVSGSDELEAYPLFTRVLEMRGEAWVDQSRLRCLFPVTEQTVGRWREIHNRRMRSVDNAATLESRDEKKILESGGAYFVHDSGKLLGIGWLEECRLLSVAAEQPGSGEQVMHTLMSLIEGAAMTLEVASTNAKAIRLYEKLGFAAIREISRWHEWKREDLE